MNLADTFRDEANDMLADLEIALLELESQPTDRDAISRVFRGLHTIKGSGGMLGYDKIAAFAHEIESTYDLIREGKCGVTPRLISLTLLARDHIKHLLDGLAGDEFESAGSRIVAEFLELQKEAGVLKDVVERKVVIKIEPRGPIRHLRQPGEEATYRIRFKPPSNVFARGLDLCLLFVDLQDLGQCSAYCHSESLPALDAFQFDRCYLFWEFVLTTASGEEAIHEVFQFVEDDDSEIEISELDMAREDLELRRLGDILVEKQSIKPDDVFAALKEQEHVSAAKKLAARSEPASLRVSAEKLDDLVNIVGEIVTMQARLTQLAAVCGDPEIAFVAEEMDRLADKLRDSTMSIRMLPIGATFEKYRRLVRDLARDLGKEVELITEGGDTELDKTVIDRINDPLVHLIRNSVDHGLEMPEEREAAGKPRTGKVVLSAIHSGAHVLIQIRDDGAGLNKQAIRDKALAKGLIKAHDELTENDVFALICSPGFSTAKTLSGVSGRGVGMDVVKQNVEGLRGTLEIGSKQGEGTIFTLKLPLTLAIIDGLLVTVAERYFVLPLANILECIELSAQTRSDNEGRQFVIVRDEMVPYVDIRRHFEISGAPPAISQVMIAETREGKFGFLVDLVVGDHKTVIKKLGGLYKDVEAVSGAAILGDGKIALILDLDKLAKAAIEATPATSLS
jgi:two-component system chemotaxis sensor kinase CheA